MSKLNNINNKNVFTVPENYFDNFSAELETRISEENLKKRFGNKNAFTVPENYFKNFSVRKPVRERKLIRVMKPWLSAAAGIIVIFALWQFLLTGIDKNNYSEKNTTDSSLNSYITADNQLNLSSDDLQYIEPELNAFIDQTDANQIYEYSKDTTNTKSLNSDDETVYQYFVDYADDNDYTALLAEL